MVEVFITNIKESNKASRFLESLRYCFPELEISFDMNNSKSAFPCGHSIIRIEGSQINPKKIISAVSRSGFKCDVLEDKVCK